MNVMDLDCYNAGCEIAKHFVEKKLKEGLLRDLGSVLRVHGPYAFLLFLHSRVKEAEQQGITDVCKELLAKYLPNPGSFDLVLVKAAEKPTDLTLAKYLLDTAFAYAGYHFKALKAKKEAEPVVEESE